jgi:hypothetical protein
VVVIWSIKRHRDPRLRIESDAPLAELLPSLSGLTYGVALKGNAVEILENGAFFEVMFEEIGRATRSVHFETFLWKDGMLGRRLVDALTQRSRAGVTVRVLVDATGGKEMGEAAVRRLEDAGCKFDTYHPKRLRNVGVLNERDHRKITVLDGRTALVGGHCIVDSWLGDAQDGEHFRDLSVRLRGPIVHAIQSAFSENWVEETGELFVGEDFFPVLHDEGDVAIHVALVKPEGSAPAVKILHPVPCDAAALAASPQRAVPEAGHMVPETAQRPMVGRNRMVGEVAAHDPLQPGSLLRDRLMPSPPQPLLDLLELRLHAVAPGLPLDEEAAGTRLAAEHGEAQEVEGLRLAEPAPRAPGRSEAAEREQAGLVRMQRQRELPQSLTHGIPEATGIGLTLEADHDVIRIA